MVKQLSYAFAAVLLCFAEIGKEAGRVDVELVKRRRLDQIVTLTTDISDFQHRVESDIPLNTEVVFILSLHLQIRIDAEHLRAGLVDVVLFERQWRRRERRHRERRNRTKDSARS